LLPNSLEGGPKGGGLSKKIEKISPKVSGARGDLPNSKGKVLSDAGISTQQASEWERLSDVPQDEFETALAEKSVRELIDKPTPVSDDALMLISTLRQFRWRGYLAMAASPAFRAAPEDSQASSGSRIFAICNAAFCRRSSMNCSNSASLASDAVPSAADRNWIV